MNFLKHTKPALLFVLLMMVFSIQQANAQLQANPDSPFIKPVVLDTPKKTAPVEMRQTGNGPSIPKFKYDSTFSPRKATIRSAMIPGWGQIYNRQIWKLPFVYGAIGTTAGIFIYNVSNYRGLRKSYIYKIDADTANDRLIPFKYSNLSANSMKFYRDEFRRNVDYSVLAFLVAWGLNVVDATVSAHLRQFDVTDDLSLKVKPTLSVNGNVGIGLVMNFK